MYCRNSYYLFIEEIYVYSVVQIPIYIFRIPLCDVLSHNTIFIFLPINYLSIIFMFSSAVKKKISFKLINRIIFR